MSKQQHNAATATQSILLPVDETFCAACVEFQRKATTPIGGAWRVVILGSIAAWVVACSFFLLLDWKPASGLEWLATITVTAVTAVGGALYLHWNAIGEFEYAFLDARGLLHRHRALPQRFESPGDPLHDWYIANIQRFGDERRLHVRTHGTHGSDGKQFLVQGAILKLRRGGWFQKIGIIANFPPARSPAWMPARCWRGMDDLVLRRLHAGTPSCELRLGRAAHLALELVNDATSDPWRLMFDHQQLATERTVHDHAFARIEESHRSALQDQLERIAALEEYEYLALFLTDHCAAMLAYLEHAKGTVGRSRHAPMLRKLIAYALSYISDRSPTLRDHVHATYIEALRRDPAGAVARAQDEATAAAGFLATLDTTARAAAREHTTAAPPTSST